MCILDLLRLHINYNHKQFKTESYKNSKNSYTSFRKPTKYNLLCPEMILLKIPEDDILDMTDTSFTDLTLASQGASLCWSDFIGFKDFSKEIHERIHEEAR